MKKIFTAIILAGIFTLLSTFAYAQTTVQVNGTTGQKYTDVSGHWAEAAIQNLADKNAFLFNGNKFMPNKAITRSEFAYMLHNALSIQIMYFKAPDINDYFTDVKQDAPYASALIDLVTANIVDKGSFKPNSTLSREEMVHYIMNAYKYKLGDLYAEVKIRPAAYKDYNKITPMYSGNVSRAASLNLIISTGKNLFHPKDNATRAESAVIIDRLLKLLEKENVVVK